MSKTPGIKIKKSKNGRPIKDYLDHEPSWDLLPKTRLEARATGAKKFYDGKTKCGRGHIYPRRETNNYCMACYFMTRRREYTPITGSEPTGTLINGSKPVRVRGRLDMNDESRNLQCKNYNHCLAWSWNGFRLAGIRFGSTWVCGDDCEFRNNES